MLKNIFVFLSLFVALLSTPILSFAADNLEKEAATPAATSAKPTVQSPGGKLNRGIVNIITAPIEIAKQIDLSWKQSAQRTENVGTGIFSGFIKGLAYTVGRMGSGIWDVASFPFQSPKNYEPLMKPDFVLEKKK